MKGTGLSVVHALSLLTVAEAELTDASRHSKLVLAPFTASYQVASSANA